MKIIGYIAWFVLAGIWTLCAQNNSAALPTASTNVNTNAVNEILALVTTNTPAAKPPPRSTTVIEADGPAVFKMTGHAVRVVYHDHVRVDSPSLKLRCEWLAADLSQAGQPTNIIAETNVVINAVGNKGQKIHAIGNKAVYVYSVQSGVTNETVTLTGKNAEADYKQIVFTGSPILVDLLHQTVSSPMNSKTIIHGTFTTDSIVHSMVGGTNSPIVTTNLPVTPTNSPETSTNLSTMRTNPPPAVTHQTTLTK